MLYDVTYDRDISDAEEYTLKELQAAGKYNNLNAADSHRLLERRDSMISSTQREMASVNLKLTETQDKLTEVNRQTAEIVPRLTKELNNSNAACATAKQSLHQLETEEAQQLKEAYAKINDLDVKMATQNDNSQAQFAEMNRVATELADTTNYQLDHLMAENRKLKEEYNKFEKSSEAGDILLKSVETQRDLAHQELKSL